jgi:hypothetical protein
VTDTPAGAAGFLAEEALRLVETIGVIAGARVSGESNPSPDGGACRAASHAGAPECRVCPVCRVIAGVRHLRPEVLAHLVAAGEELLAAARELAASTPSPAASTSPGSGPGTGAARAAGAAQSAGGGAAGADIPAQPRDPHQARDRHHARVSQRIELD